MQQCRLTKTSTIIRLHSTSIIFPREHFPSLLRAPPSMPKHHILWNKHFWKYCMIRVSRHFHINEAILHLKTDILYILKYLGHNTAFLESLWSILQLDTSDVHKEITVTFSCRLNDWSPLVLCWTETKIILMLTNSYFHTCLKITASI